MSQTMNTQSKCLGGGGGGQMSECKWDHPPCYCLCKHAKHTVDMHLSINFVSKRLKPTGSLWLELKMRRSAYCNTVHKY